MATPLLIRLSSNSLDLYEGALSECTQLGNPLKVNTLSNCRMAVCELVLAHGKQKGKRKNLSIITNK